MPLTRIDVPQTMDPARRRIVADVVDEAMRAMLGVPENDRFQVVRAHAAEDLLVDPSYLDIARSRDAILVQVTLNAGRTVEMKRAFYAALADGLAARAGLRREDVVISLVEVAKENWSFGNGIAQYAA